MFEITASIKLKHLSSYVVALYDECEAPYSDVISPEKQ